MKKLLIALLLFPSFLASQPLCPLFEEDAHFIKYRCMMIESSLYNLEDIAEMMLREDLTLEEGLHEMEYHLKNIRFNLGVDY